MTPLQRVVTAAPPSLPARSTEPPPPVPFPVPPPPRRPLRTAGRVLGLAGAGVVVAVGLAAGVASRGGWYVDVEPGVATSGAVAEPAPEPKVAARGVYVVVDTWENRFRIYRNGELLREAVCSTGSGTILRDPRDGRQWVFDTPLGERRVLRKTRDPVWTKPDWAFVEEGKLPPKDFRERIDDLSLGDYSLDLGDGYLVHGTLFQTLLGQRLTHGCIRLGDADLEWVFRHVPLGARVYLF